MRPASRFLDSPALVKMMEASVGISLQDAAELTQMFTRMLTPPVRRVSKPHRRRRSVTSRTVITHIGPQPSGLRLAVAGREHRNRRVIGVQFARAHHVPMQCLY